MIVDESLTAPTDLNRLAFRSRRNFTVEKVRSGGCIPSPLGEAKPPTLIGERFSGSPVVPPFANVHGLPMTTSNSGMSARYRQLPGSRSAHAGGGGGWLGGALGWAGGAAGCGAAAG